MAQARTLPRTKLPTGRVTGDQRFTKGHKENKETETRTKRNLCPTGMRGHWGRGPGSEEPELGGRFGIGRASDKVFNL